MSRVILFGLTEMSEMMLFYLTHDSPHRVVAFTVDEKYVSCDSFCGLPVVPFETIEQFYPPAENELGVLLGFTEINRLRARKYVEGKAKGYRMITYVSSKATTWPGMVIGENSYVFENSLVMPFSRIGNNVFISVGSLVGHHSTIEDHTFVSAHVVVLGGSRIGKYCILGANATIKDNVAVDESCVIGVGAEITKSTKPGQVFVNPAPQLLNRTSDQLSNWLAWSYARRIKP